jgi:hypothetical protein
VHPPETVYNQNASHFTLRFFIGPDTEVPGDLVVELAERFLSQLLFPGCRPVSLDTKRPGEGHALNMGEFSERRWKASVRKVRAGEYAVLGIKAHTPDFPQQKIWFNAHINPPGGDEFLVSGTIEVSCSLAYLRHLAVSTAMVDALLEFGRRTWNGIDGGPAYGFGNLAMTLARPRFDPLAPRPTGAPMPWDIIMPPAEPAHAVPIAYVGNDIDGNLAALYCNGRGIKGAFWANYLSAAHVRLAGGPDDLRAKLSGIRTEPLEHGGMLVVAANSPLPEDSADNQRRFQQIHEALRPAFLSWEETPEGKRPMLGYFYRERAHETT